MFIKNLTVSKGTTKEVIRDISFNNRITGELTGLKLIVDNDQNGMSNNVGKSTVITSIDFCLGAKPSVLFHGMGKSHSDSTIEEFLYNNNIIFQLVIENTNKDTYIIEREFVKSTTKSGKEKKGTIWTLNGEKIKDNNKELKLIFFGDEENKPSFRQLIGKFLRDDSFSLGDPIRFYHNITKKEDARAILDRLFYHNAASTITQEKDLRLDLKNCEAALVILQKQHTSIIQLEEFIQKQQETIEDFNKELDQSKPSKFTEEYLDNRQKFLTLLEEISYLSSEVTSINQSIERYQNDQSNIDLQAVQLLFNEMKFYNSSLDKTFIETIKFHESMLVSRVEYLKTIVEEKKQELQIKQTLEQQFSISLDERYIENNKKSRDYLLKKLKMEEDCEKKQSDLERWSALKLKKIEIKEQLTQISDDDNNNSIDTFNMFFEQFTHIIYNEKMFLSIPTEYTPYVLKDVTNTGTGKEKGIITSFDLAYIAYINEINKKAPLFTAIDIFEPTDEPTIQKIFDIANSLNGQLIVPVLRSKIDFIEDIEQYFIVELNSDDKFFKVP